MESEMLLCGAYDLSAEVPAPVLMRELCLTGENVRNRVVAWLENNDA
jgi:hypothetical protein